MEVGDWVDPAGESRDVAVRLRAEDRVTASNIEHLPVAVAGTNMMVPLEQIATVTLDKGPARIQHLDGSRTVTVSANVEGRAAGEVTADRFLWLGPAGVPTTPVLMSYFFRPGIFLSSFSMVAAGIGAPPKPPIRQLDKS